MSHYRIILQTQSSSITGMLGSTGVLDHVHTPAEPDVNISWEPPDSMTPKEVGDRVERMVEIVERLRGIAK